MPNIYMLIDWGNWFEYRASVNAFVGKCVWLETNLLKRLILWIVIKRKFGFVQKFRGLKVSSSTSKSLQFANVSQFAQVKNRKYLCYDPSIKFGIIFVSTGH